MFITFLFTVIRYFTLRQPTLLLASIVCLSLIGCFGTFDRIYTFKGTIISEDGAPLNGCFFDLSSEDDLANDFRGAEVDSHFNIDYIYWRNPNSSVVRIKCGKNFHVNNIIKLGKYLNSSGEYDLGTITIKNIKSN